MVSTKNTYQLPVELTKVKRIVTGGPGHPGQYSTAIDYAVNVGTDVLAPLNGEIIVVVDKYSEYGTTSDFANKANYIQIKHNNREISDLIHLAKGSICVNVGDKVVRGQLIAKTGLSGWMTEPHLHWFVYRHAKNKQGFEGLKIKLD